MTVTVTFDVETDDLIRVGQLGQTQPLWVNFMLILFVIVVPIWIWAKTVTLSAAVVPGVLLVLIFAIPRLRRGETARARREQVPIYHFEQTFECSPSGVRIASIVATAEYKWGAFMRARETRDYFLFYVAPRRAAFVPKRALRSPADVEAIRAMAIEGMSSAGRRFEPYLPSERSAP